MKPAQINISFPMQNISTPPDHERIGAILDDIIKKHFTGKRVIIRCIGSQDHPDKNVDELAELIVQLGTDKYDDSRKGVGYANFLKKGVRIDFYGQLIEEVNDDMSIMCEMIYEMYHSAIGDRGYGVYVDLVLIYDAEQLNMVTNLYESQILSDGFVFKDSEHKQLALMGIIKIAE